MGMDKLAWQLDGKPVLLRSLEALLAVETIGSVVVVCPESRWKLLAGHTFHKPVTRTDGGATRHESVSLGFAAISNSPTLVAIHDAARPLVSPCDIARCIEAASEHRAASLASRSTATMMRATDDDFATAHVSRDGLWCMETPQVFSAELLRDALAHVSANALEVTDEVSAALHLGVATKLVESTRPNLKITTPSDLALAEALLHISA